MKENCSILWNITKKDSKVILHVEFKFSKLAPKTRKISQDCKASFLISVQSPLKLEQMPPFD